jgi:drug/metabolite transporter (DMT)-like permease
MWFTLALASALFQVLRNMAMKRLGHALDETINVWGRFTFLLPFAAAGVAALSVPGVADSLGIARRGFAGLGSAFWGLSFLFGVSQNLGTLSLSRALKESEISLVTSLWKISLLLLVAWGYLTLGETPSPLGFTGVMISMAGVYLLNVHKARISYWGPLVSLVQDPGQRWTLLAGIGYAVSVVLIKRMAQLSDPMMAVFVGYVFCALIATPYALYRSAPYFRQVGRYWKSFVSMGLFGTLSTWFGTTAYTMTLSSYVEAVKQVEVLLAVAIGYLIFQEGARIRVIWAGSVAIMIGMVLLKLGA